VGAAPHEQERTNIGAKKTSNTASAAYFSNLQPFALKSLTATLDWAPSVGAAPQGQMRTLERGRYDTHSFNNTPLQLPTFNSQLTHRDNWIGHLVVGAAY